MATLVVNVAHRERDPTDIHTATAAKRGWPLHPDTVAARNELLLARGRPRRRGAL